MFKMFEVCFLIGKTWHVCVVMHGEKAAVKITVIQSVSVTVQLALFSLSACILF